MKRILVLVTVAGLFSLLSACGRKNIPSGWVEHRDPLGFTVAHPKGWEVKASKDGLVRVQSADGESAALIQPFFLPQLATAEQVLYQVPNAFGFIYPRARIQSSRRVREMPDEALSVISYQGEEGRGRASVLCSLYGRSGMLFAIGAPDSEFDALKPQLVQILKTFSFSEPTKRKKEKSPDEQFGLKYVRWHDPKENAFSIEIPKGWSVDGGLFRFHAVDVRPTMQVLSPDGKIRITGGDPEVPTFSLPSPMLAMTGFREGSMYSPGYGFTTQVRRYVPGAQFAEWYVTEKAARDCAGLEFVDRRNREDLVDQVNATLARYGALGLGVRMDAGEVAFKCRKGPDELHGYYLAATQVVDMQGGGIWHLEHLFGYLATPGQEAKAQAVLGHMIRTFEVNPQWFAAQQNLTARTSEIVSETHNYISNIIDQNYWNKNRSQDEIMRKWSNMMLGQTDVVDPETGETWKVAAGHNFYWRKPHTDVGVGTETFTRPDIEFEPLLEF